MRFRSLFLSPNVPKEFGEVTARNAMGLVMLAVVIGNITLGFAQAAALGTIAPLIIAALVVFIVVQAFVDGLSFGGLPSRGVALGVASIFVLSRYMGAMGEPTPEWVLELLLVSMWFTIRIYSIGPRGGWMNHYFKAYGLK